MPTAARTHPYLDRLTDALRIELAQAREDAARATTATARTLAKTRVRLLRNQLHHLR